MKNNKTKKPKIVKIKQFFEFGTNMILLAGAFIALVISFIQIISKRDKK